MKQKLAHYHRQYQSLGYRDRTMLLSTGSVALNALIGSGKLLLGLFLFSPWLIATAIYYLLLCGARGQLLHRFHQTRCIEDPQNRFHRQFAVFRHSGIFICGIGLSYLLVCLLMYFREEGTSYPFYLLYGVAAVAFFKIGTAIYGMAVSRRIKNPLLTAIKIIATMDASVSIVAVQCALLTVEESAQAATQSSALLGAGCSVAFMATGIWMLLKKKKYPGTDQFDQPEQMGKLKQSERGELEMAKSKLIQVNQQIANKVVTGYHLVESGVVGGFHKISDQFVDAFLTKEGETVEKANERLAAENKARIEQTKARQDEKQ